MKDSEPRRPTPSPAVLVKLSPSQSQSVALLTEPHKPLPGVSGVARGQPLPSSRQPEPRHQGDRYVIRH
jgi:hypothetical protein